MPPITRVIEKQPIDIEPIFDSLTENDNDELGLDLMYHPSYQEQSNNRRRRRRRSPEGVPEKEVPSKVLPTLAEVEPENDYEPPRVEERKAVKVTPIREGDRTIRLPRREEAPLERVSVPMDELQQEVYSEMGISPLILLDRTFKDPRAVVVSVKTTTEVNRHESEPIEEVEPELASELVQNEQPSTEILTTQEITPSNELTEEANIRDLSTGDTLEEESTESEEDDLERPVLRRRRRRSSATVG